MIDYNVMAKEIHAQNVAVGWWDAPNPCIYEKLQLVSTEIAEATEAERKNLMDDHLPNRKGGEVELADALIRVLDLGGYLKLPFRYGYEAMTPVFEVKTIGGMHLNINKALVDFAYSIDDAEWNDINYSVLVDLITDTANSQGYDIESAMLEKIEYNKQRADHKRENRAMAGGKAF